MTQGIHFQIEAHARLRYNLAFHHLFGACRYTSKVKELEKEHAGKQFGGFWEEILQNCLGVATLSVGCLEGFANELYFEDEIFSSKLNPPAAKEIAKIIDRKSILDKFSLAFAILTENNFNSGFLPIQNVKALIKLRNEVVHFRPEWYGEPGKHQNLSGNLKDKFKPSPFLTAEKDLFPIAWASHDFCKWALRSATEFLEYFYQEVNIKCPLSRFKNKIEDLSGMQFDFLPTP